MADEGRVVGEAARQCELFVFVISGVLIGSLCLAGFFTIGTSFVLFWRQKGRCPLVRTLMTMCIADGALLWVLFLVEALPGLAYVAPFMRNCTAVCTFLRVLTSPVRLVVQGCGGWLTVLVAHIQYLVTCSPLRATRDCVPSNVNKKILILLFVATTCSIPQLFERQIQVTDTWHSNETIPLSQHWIYKGFYTNAFQFFFLYLLPVGSVVFIMARMMFAKRNFSDEDEAVVPRMPSVSMNRVVISIVSVYVLTLLMPTVHKLVTWAEGDDVNTCKHVEFYLGSFSNLFLTINASVKFLLYCMFMPHFMKSLRDTFITGRQVEPFGYKCKDMSEMTLISNSESRN